MTIFGLTISCSAFSQQKFPSWMDEVNLKENSQGFNEPSAPIDPSTGQPAPTSRPAGSAFGKPVLPDFAKMREKAVKAELEKRLAADGELENSYSASISNLDQLKENKTRLESLLAANPSENERQMLLSGLGDLSQKLALSQEFIKLLGGSSDGANQRTPVASLTQPQFNRAIELQKLLFPGSGKRKATGYIPADNRVASLTTNLNQKITKDPELEPTEEELRKSRTYQPGKIKSFYLESKKKEQQQEAENE